MNSAAPLQFRAEGEATGCSANANYILCATGNCLIAHVICIIRSFAWKFRDLIDCDYAAHFQTDLGIHCIVRRINQEIIITFVQCK